MTRFWVILVSLILISSLILSACSGSPSPTSTAKAPASSTAAPATTTSATSSAAPKPSQSAPASPASAEVKTIKFSYTMPKGAAIAKGFDWFGPAFEKATNGRYKVETYPGSTLVAVSSGYDSIKGGVVQMAYVGATTFPKQFPLTLLLSIPSLGFPANTVQGCADASTAIRELYDTVPEIAAEFKDVTLLQASALAPYNLVSKRKPILSATDFRGMKVGGSAQKMEMVVANSGAKVQMSPPDSYLNLDKGVVDAAFVTLGQVDDYKLYEIADWYSLQEFGNGIGLILMYKDFYSKMAPADQKILADVWRQALDVSSQGSIDSIEKGKQDVINAKKTLYKPTAAEAAAWDAQSVPAINAWRNEAKQLGLTDAILDKVVNAWKPIRQKYYPK